MVNKVNLLRWGGHLARAKAKGITLAQYARENGLSRHTLYAASQQQRAQAAVQRIEVRPGLPRKGQAPRGAFIAVRLPEIAEVPERTADRGVAVLQARLPNGVHIDIEVDAAQPSAAAAQAPWAQVLQALAGLPCSR